MPIKMKINMVPKSRYIDLFALLENVNLESYLKFGQGKLDEVSTYFSVRTMIEIKVPGIRLLSPISLT